MSGKIEEKYSFRQFKKEILLQTKQGKHNLVSTNKCATAQRIVHYPGMLNNIRFFEKKL